MIKLDLNIGYFIIPIAKESQYIYSFITLWGKYTYTRLSFRDTEVPDIFQQFMHKMLEDLEFMMIYLNDVLLLVNLQKSILQM